MPTVVRLNDGRSRASLETPENPIPTQRGLPMPERTASIGQVTKEASDSGIRENEPKKLIPRIEKPYQVMDGERVKFYRVHPRGESTFYMITVDEQEIGPFILIQEVKNDRGRFFVKLSPDTVPIPGKLRHLVYFQKMAYVYDSQLPDCFIFVAPDADTENVRQIMRSKYPNPRAGELPHVVKSHASTYLVICGLSVG